MHERNIAIAAPTENCLLLSILFLVGTTGLDLVTAYKTRLIILTMFLVRTITTWTLLDGTLTVTLIPTLRQTLALLRQRLYRTSEAPLKLLHVYYNLTIYVLRTNR